MSQEPITCLAAVAWGPNIPLKIETVVVDPPKSGEVRIKIVATGVCHTDLSSNEEVLTAESYPVILGHEGAGIVESVGDGVDDLAPGDHVLTLVCSQCAKCDYCRHPESTICRGFVDIVDAKGLLADGTTRFSCNGKRVRHFYACSTFSEYTVCPRESVVKISKKSPLDKICIYACCIPTGYGAPFYNVQVRQGSSCVVFGLGGIGLACIMGCKAAGATKIIAVDINSSKFELAQRLGATDVVNPRELQGRDIVDTLRGMTDDGVDFAFECVGNIHLMRQAFDACHISWGVVVVIGLPEGEGILPISAVDLLYGKRIMGSVLGGVKKVDLPKLIDEYDRGNIPSDSLITHNFPLDEINTAVQTMKEGKRLEVITAGSIHETRDTLIEAAFADTKTIFVFGVRRM